MRTSETDLVGALLALDKAKDGRVSYDEFKVSTAANAVKALFPRKRFLFHTCGLERRVHRCHVLGKSCMLQGSIVHVGTKFKI